jgi:hypothetical protein
MFVDSEAISMKSSANQEFDAIRNQRSTNIAKTGSDGLAAIRLNTAYIDAGLWSSRRPEDDVVTNHTYIARVDGAKNETFPVNAIPGATSAASVYRVTVLSIDPPRWPH